jgi:hypothetical protein
MHTQSESDYNGKHSYFEFTGHTMETNGGASVKGLCPRYGDYRTFQAAPKKLRDFTEGAIRGGGPHGTGWEGKALQTLQMPGKEEMWKVDNAEATVVRRISDTGTPDRLAGVVSVQIHYGPGAQGAPHRDMVAGAFHVGVTANGRRTLKFDGLSNELVQDRGSFYWYTNTWIRARAHTRLTAEYASLAQYTYYIYTPSLSRAACRPQRWRSITSCIPNATRRTGR